MSRLFELTERQLLKFRKIAVFGDLHGDYAALQSGLSLFDPARDGIIFLGDYADRGICGVEVLDTVIALKKKHPDNLFPLKGNHEDYEAGHPKFSPCSLVEEANGKLGSWRNYFESKLQPFIDSLHLCIVVPNETLFLHGGVSSKIQSLSDLEQPKADVEEDLLWSDPFEGNGEHPNPRGAGVLFGRDITIGVCERLGLKRIIRSHEPLKVKFSGGPCYSHSRRIITTGTTTVYGGQPFVLSIDPNDFSCTSYEVGTGKPIKSSIVECKQIQTF